MANWTVATAYQRFQDVMSEEFDVAFDQLDGDHVKLEDIKVKFEARIVRDAMAGANRVPVGRPKPTATKAPKLTPAQQDQAGDGG